MRKMTSWTLIVAGTKLLQISVISFGEGQWTYRDHVLVHIPPLLLINHPSVWVELVCVLAENLLVLVDDMWIYAQYDLFHVRQLFT